MVGFISRYNAKFEEFKPIDYKDKQELVAAKKLDRNLANNYEWENRQVRMNIWSFFGAFFLIIALLIVIGSALYWAAVAAIPEKNDEATTALGLMAGGGFLGFCGASMMGIAQLDGWLGARLLQSLLDKHAENNPPKHPIEHPGSLN